MKTKKLVGICCLLAAGTGCALFGACSINNGKPDKPDEPATRITSDWETMPENTNENLKYFGYFHSDGFRSQGSYIDEIASLENSNVLMINSCFDNAKAAEWLEKAKSVNQQVIFSVHGLFEGGQLKKANSATLLSDYAETLSGLKETLKSYIDDGTLLGFYFDEPAWNGVKEEDFRTVTKWIRENIPSIKVITTMTTSDIGMSKTENYPEINASYNEYCTDVMYDYYGAWNDDSRLTYLDKLKSKATEDQWIWGCATGFVNNAEQTDELYNAIRGMYTEAIQEERYAGIVSFSYADGLEGDWGYGLHTFLNNDSEYYDADLRKLYTDIGREVIGAGAYDYSSLIDLTLVAPTEIYELGERIDLPAAGAVDGMKNVIPVTYKLVSPSGAEMPVESFVATESGKYEVTVTAEKNGKKVTKKCYISVRGKGEISTFDDEANLSDAGGTDSDTWCWPRQIDHAFYRTGGGSLKITPHPKDGTWPRIIFQRNGYQLWDLSEAGAVSMWVYNTSDKPIDGFALMVSDETLDTNQTVYSKVQLPAKQWTEVSISVKVIQETKPSLDLTKVTVFYGNAAADYANRAEFYIDDVTILEKAAEETENIGFENIDDIARIGGTENDEWCWPVAISAEQKHGGSKSLKITPHATDGTWPRRLFKSTDGDTYDLSGYAYISLWAYFDSTSAADNFGLYFEDAAGGKAEFKFNLAAKEWTEMKVTKEQIMAKNSAFDLTTAKVYFGQLGATYPDRSPIYLDDFTLEKASETPDVKPVPDGARGFETAEDLNTIGDNADDLWTWPVSISGEQAHTGTKSLKITVRQDGGNWPNVVFKKDAATERFDISKLNYISFFVYLDSESEDGISTFGLKINNGENVNQMTKTVKLPARVWTEIRISKAEILAGAAKIDVTQVKISYANLGSAYPSDKSDFYIDDFVFAESEGAEAEKSVLDFESDGDIAKIGNNADDLWTWPVSISGEQAHSGTKSLKITVRQDGGMWPNVVFKKDAETLLWDLTKIEKISVWVYFDSDNDMETFAWKFCNDNGAGGEANTVTKTVKLTARVWTEITVTRAEIEALGGKLDMTKAYVKIGQCGGTYADKANFYIDDFTATEK